MLDYTKAVKVNPKMTDAYYNMAEIILTRKDIINPNILKAIEYLEKALELDNRFIDALFAMAAAYKKLGEYHKALEYLEKLLQLEPQAVNAKALKKLILQKYIL
jgi:cytochrome c-type biogenesis protein CcmH/NrfG